MIDTIRLKIAPSFAPIGMGVVAPKVDNNTVHATALLEYESVMPSGYALWQASLTEQAPGKLSPIRLCPERNLGTGLEPVEIPLGKFDTFKREVHKMTAVTLKAACENFAFKVLSARNDLFKLFSFKAREFRILSGMDEGRPISIEMRQVGYQLVPIVNIGLHQHETSTFKGALDYAISIASETSAGKQDSGHTYYNMDVGYD